VIEILPESRLTIEGESNVNCFTFQYDQKLLNYDLCVTANSLNNKIDLKNANLNLNIKGFDSGNSLMNKDFYDLLNVSQHPTLEISLLSAKPNLNSLNEYIELETQISIAGEKRIEKIIVRPITLDSYWHFIGKTDLNLNNYNIAPPSKFFGMVKVKDQLKIEFDLRFRMSKLEN
jgi:hypothetical protein